MIKMLKVANFAAVPHLEETRLMRAHPEGIKFSTTKPNVLVGPNGSGKSSLLQALALHTLSYFVGRSSFDNNFTSRSPQSEPFWGNEGSPWLKKFKYLPGLTCDSDFGPALFYRPGHIPGNDDSVTAAMMCGYFKEARSYGELVAKKSSGQQGQARLAELQAVLKGEIQDIGYQYVNWTAGKEPRSLNGPGWIGDWDHQAEVLKAQYAKVSLNAIPVLLMDEPEQSLDARAEVELWNQISNADMTKLQVIVATHSLYPLMHPERFNLIETAPGYASEVRALMQLS